MAQPRRGISISVTSSLPECSVQDLLSHLEKVKGEHPKLIKEIKFLSLPFSTETFRLSKDNPVDVLLLCHSINNRRFAITDVPDALYDKFLRHCQKVLGREKTGVIVHDFDDQLSLDDHKVNRQICRQQQPTTYSSASLVITCGSLDTPGEEIRLTAEDQEELLTFLEKATVQQEEMRPDGVFQEIKAKASSINITCLASGRAPSSPVQSRASLYRSPVKSSAGAWPYFPRAISVSICTSAHDVSVGSIFSHVLTIKERDPSMIHDIRVRTLPYNDIDSFKFPSGDPVDVMVLCHSVENRGFSITNVPNALYDKYLKYCHNTIGRSKLAVIVHDLAGWTPTTTYEEKIRYFRSTQPLTFELVDLVIVCGRLDSDKSEPVQINQQDLNKLTMFFMASTNEPRENKSRFSLLSSSKTRQPRGTFIV